MSEEIYAGRNGKRRRAAKPAGDGEPMSFAQKTLMQTAAAAIIIALLFAARATKHPQAADTISALKSAVAYTSDISWIGEYLNKNVLKYLPSPFASPAATTAPANSPGAKEAGPAESAAPSILDQTPVHTRETVVLPDVSGETGSI